MSVKEDPDLKKKKKKRSLEMSTLFETALELLLLLWQEFGAAFQEVTKNVVLLTNLKQKLNFGIQKTAHANFVKITSIK